MSFSDLASSRLSRRRFLGAGATLGAGALLAGCTSRYSMPGKRITLSQWFHQYGEDGTRDAVFRYADQYMKENPDIGIQVQWVPGDYGTKLNTALLVAGGPDVFESSHLSVPMVVAGQVATLDDLYPADVKADFLPADLAVNTVDGHIYGVKMVDDTGLIYYRKSLLEKAGFSKPPATFDELIEAAKALNTKGRKGLFLGNDGGTGALMTIGPWSAGQDFLKEDKLVFNTERTAQVYEKLRTLNDTGTLLRGAPADWWDPSAFNQGLCAMAWGGLWAYPGIKKFFDDNAKKNGFDSDDIGGMAWPAFDKDGSPATFAGGWSQMVNARSPHVDEAKRFVQWLWMKNQKIQTDWNLSYGFHVPPRQSVARTATALRAPVPAQAARDLAQHGGATGPSWTNGMNTAISDAVTNILGGSNAKDELNTAERKCQRELARLLR
ncbi:sugar ABC transporter substrate-binding protein [bacterium]|nr:MAG: sugar ABC transporter substrate-binding protein [bacterium]